MIDTDLKDKYEPTKDAIFNTLLNIYSYRQKMKRLPEILKSGTRCIMIQEMTALRALFHCIILQLCILDDDISDYSFQKIKKDINKLSMAQKEKNIISTSINEYREILTRSKIKTEHRNMYIAHMHNDIIPNVTNLPDYEKEVKFIVQKMLSTYSTIWGYEYKFILNVGSQEKQVDLVEESK